MDADVYRIWESNVLSDFIAYNGPEMMSGGFATENYPCSSISQGHQERKLNHFR